MEPLSDEQVVREVLQGNKESYALLVDRYKALAYRLSYDLLGDVDQAEEVVQETFIAAYTRLDRLTRPDRFGVWVATIARNRSCTALRRRGRTPESLEALAEKGFIPPAAPADPPGEDEKLAALRTAVARLPPPHREILELRYTKEFTCERIAAFLDISVSAVKVRLHRARKRVLAILKKEGWT